MIRFMRTFATGNVMMEIWYEGGKTVSSKELRNLVRQLELVTGWLEEDERQQTVEVGT